MRPARPPGGLRKGKWTPEEEAYANKIILLFNQGLLTVGPGTTLRSFLSEKLNCDPMRITKKFAGASCIGKQVYQPSEDVDLDDLRFADEELNKLEAIFLARLNGKAGSRSSAGAAASQFDDENEDEYGNDDDQFDEGGDAMDDGEDKAAGAAAGGGGSGRGSWSTSRRGGGRGGGLPTGALRHGAGGAGGTRRTLSAPDLQAFNVVASGQGSMRRTSPTGGWTANKVKRSYSTMDLEDLGQQFRPGATSDSDAAALLMKFMTKLGSEPSLSRSNSHVDLAAAAEAAVHATNEQAAAADIIASVGQRSFASAAAAEVKEEFAVGGTLKAGGLASSSSNELQSGVTDRSGSLGTETSRSSSNSRVGSIDDPTSMSVCGEGGVRGRNDSHESLSPVGLTMDDEMEGGNPPPVAAVGVFGSSAGQGLGRRAAGSSVFQADKIVQVRPALGGPAPQGAPPTSS